MCGFAVAITRGGREPLSETRLAAALAALAHRGPDAAGVGRTRLGRDGPEIAMAHARLSILDLDRRSNQPFVRKGHRLVYNGEIYNFRDLAGAMRLDTSGDTEVLLNLLRESGPEAARACNGFFSFVWLDEVAGRLTAMRDAYGRKPLFWKADGERILIASTLGALAALSGETPTLRTERLGDFLTSGWLFPDATGGEAPVEGVNELRPGHALEIDVAGWSWTQRRILEVDCGDPSAPPDDAELPALFADAVASRLVSDRKVGLMLSGGVDSTLILSALAALGRLNDLVCLTGEAGKSEDGAYARACAAALGARAIELPLDYGAAGLDLFLDVCRHQEKPFPLIGNVLGLHALYKAAAREGVSVALDGAGADEIFGGYWYRYAGYALAEGAHDSAWRDGVLKGGMVPRRFTDGKGARAPALDRLEGQDIAWLSAEGLAVRDAARDGDPLAGFEGSLHEALRRDATAGRMQEWLWQNDRAAMASGIENRSPFLDERLARWMAQGHRAKFDGALNKPVLRRLFQSFRRLPSAARVDKQGFRWVQGRFARRNRDALVDLIASSQSAGRLIRRDAFLDGMAADPALIEGRLAQRLMVLAGLEATGRIA